MYTKLRLLDNLYSLIFIVFNFFFVFSSDNMYDPKTIKAENNQRSLLKIVDGGHILADHSFDHMSHNSKDSPQNAYTNVERDMVIIFFQKISQAFLHILKS